MNTTNTKRKLQSGILRLAVAVAVAVLGMGRAAAQTVTVSPQTGNVISVSSYTGERHLAGYGGAWIHNQLPLTLITSDRTGLTASGLMAEHANNIKPNGTGFILASGDAGGSSGVNNYMSLSLPQGYRFTGYKMVLAYDSGQGCTMRECDPSFKDEKKSVTISSSTTKAVLSRTSADDHDMGNTLYFHQYLTSSTSYVRIVSLTINFECTDKFDVLLRPADTDIDKAVDCLALPFATQRVDFGPITKKTDESYTSYKYDYEKVSDLTAYFNLYDESGIDGGSAKPGKTGRGSIVSLKNEKGLTYYGLKNDTYYVESPTEAITQDGKSVPVGYRIVGARVVYSNTPSVAFDRGDIVCITDGKGRYLNADLKYTTTRTEWLYDTNGKVSTGSGQERVYLRHNSEGILWWKEYYLDTTTDISKATTYSTDGMTLYYGSGSSAYVVGVKGNEGAYTNDYAAVMKADAGKGSSFRLTLYGKDGKAVLKSVDVSDANPSGSLVGEKFNNDAIKFAVSGLAADAQAYVCVEMQLETLNPYVDKMDVVCTQADGSRHVSAQYLADDFTIGDNGRIQFAVPTNFATGGVSFSFDALNHKKADDTYAHCGTAGEYSRYNFVQSDYYKLIGENLQQHAGEAADYDYTEKIRVAVAGDKAFRCNNSDLFKAGTTGAGTFSYEEYRYSDALYASQGGTWNEVTATDGGAARGCYLAVCDETRYNIAPTTTPRHAVYAYYSTNLSLTTKDYRPVVVYTNVYDHAMLASGYDQQPYAGASLTLVDDAGQAVAPGTGYVSMKQLTGKIKDDIAGKKNGAPTSADHILYVDASSVGMLLADDATTNEWGSMSDLQAIIGKNALTYLPKGVTFNANNVATQSISGDDFVADNDIVLTDKLPFYAPYGIRVNAANTVSYTREVVNAGMHPEYVTLAMPFGISLDEGVHRNSSSPDDGAFEVYAMQADNAFSPGDAENHDYGMTGHFALVSGTGYTEANMPYLVRIAEHASVSSDSPQLFTLRQAGATIMATPGNGVAANPVSGTIDGKKLTMTMNGSFSGEKIAKDKETFYFANDRFLCSSNLAGQHDAVLVLPFRAWYDCSVSSGKRMMNISLEPNDWTTAIGGVDADADGSQQAISVSVAGGAIVLTAARDAAATVCGTDGRVVATLRLAAGETATVDVPAGIYVAAGRKVLVN